ncbi:MAG: hypothetical protein WDO16_05420 [Bacteroidota bacterium]
MRRRSCLQKLGWMGTLLLIATAALSQPTFPENGVADNREGLLCFHQRYYRKRRANYPEQCHINYPQRKDHSGRRRYYDT